MILDSFLRIIQIWTRNSASHLSMEVVGEKTRIKNWWFCFSLKDEFSSAKQSRIFFSQTLNPEIFLFSKRNCLLGAILKVSQQMVNTRWMFPTKGRISLSKNFELKYFTSLKIVHTFTLTNTYIMFCTVFLDRVLLLVCLYPKQAFVWK